MRRGHDISGNYEVDGLLVLVLLACCAELCCGLLILMGRLVGGAFLFHFFQKLLVLLQYSTIK